MEDEYWKTSGELWKKLKPLAREHRQTPTEAEDKLWQSLRGRKLCGHKFRRQHSIERFIVDFYCSEAKLVIEVDGEIHLEQVDQDVARQEWLEAQGHRVIRFSNEQVLHSLGDILVAISNVLDSHEAS